MTRPVYYGARWVGDNVSRYIAPERFDSRRDFVEFIRLQCYSAGMPERARRQLNCVKLWRVLQSNGSSGINFALRNTQCGKVERIRFMGMSEEEFYNVLS